MGFVDWGLAMSVCIGLIVGCIIAAILFRLVRAVMPGSDLRDMLHEWEVINGKYRALNDAAEDMAWAMREFEATAPFPLPDGWFAALLKVEEEKAWKEYEESQKGKVITTDRHLRLSSARRTLLKWEQERGGMMQLEDIRAKVNEVKGDERAHVVAAICSAQLALENVKRAIDRPGPDWKKAGDYFMPVFMVGLSGVIKHAIFSKVKEFACDEPDYVPKAFMDFKAENPINMTEVDAKEIL